MLVPPSLLERSLRRRRLLQLSLASLMALLLPHRHRRCRRRRQGEAAPTGWFGHC